MPNISAAKLPLSFGVQAGGFIFISGQGPVDRRTNEVVLGTIEVQTTKVLENLKAVAESAGATLADIVKVTVFLSRGEDFEKMNAVYRTFFPKDPPARSTILAGLARKGMMVEIEAIAYKP